MQRVVGEFSLAGVHSLPLEELWRRTRKYAGIDKEYFDAYFAGCDVGHALEVGDIVCYETPLRLEVVCGIKRPPQSFCYVNAGL